MKMCFVVLHYKTLEATIECVESLLLLNEQKDIAIVVVDNGSNDGTGQSIKKKYQHLDRVRVLIENQGRGFSAGNNIGYIYAKKNFSPQYIALLNNDTMILQKDFISLVEKAFKETGFAVLGPDIYEPAHGKHQSPVRMRIPSVSDIEKEVEEHKRLRRHMVKYEMEERCMNFLSKFKKKKMESSSKHSRIMENVVISGAGLIVSSDYINHYEKAFEPEVQFYYEETFLLLKCMRDHMKVVYYPGIQIVHKHRVSTSKNRNFIEKRKFFHGNIIESGERLIEFMKDKGI